MKSDGPGYRNGWICPSCDKVLWKPNRLAGGQRQRFHSASCREPMIACTVAWLHHYDATTYTYEVTRRGQS